MQSEQPRLNFKDKYSESYRNSHPSAPVIVPWISGVVSAWFGFLSIWTANLKITCGDDCVLETRTESKLTLVKILPCYLKLVSLFFFSFVSFIFGVFWGSRGFWVREVGFFCRFYTKAFMWMQATIPLSWIWYQFYFLTSKKVITDVFWSGLW